jgi:tryptophanyl-tRNA synthetase
LRKLILKIKTNSLPAEAPKDPDSCTLFSLYQAFASPEEVEKMRQRYRAGIGWGEMKQLLFEYLNEHFCEARMRYEALLQSPQEIERKLQEGAAKAREYAVPFMRQIRRAVGIAPLAE